jgi:hypothetical protein
MPPVRVMGHLLPSRLPDKRSRRTYSKHSTNPQGGSMLLARTLRAGYRVKTLSLSEGSWDPFVQAAERYSLRLMPGRSAYRT